MALVLPQNSSVRPETLFLPIILFSNSPNFAYYLLFSRELPIIPFFIMLQNFDEIAIIHNTTDQ